MRTTVRTKIGLGAAVLALGLCTAALACGESALPTHNAIAEDPATARLAIAALRAQGPAGLRWLMNTYAADVERFTRGEAVATDAERQNVRMLQEQQQVARAAALSVGDERALQRERFSVAHDPEPPHFKAAQDPSSPAAASPST